MHLHTSLHIFLYIYFSNSLGICIKPNLMIQIFLKFFWENKIHVQCTLISSSGLTLPTCDGRLPVWSIDCTNVVEEGTKYTCKERWTGMINNKFRILICKCLDLSKCIHHKASTTLSWDQCPEFMRDGEGAGLISNSHFTTIFANFHRV